MTKLRINPGICKFTTTVEAEIDGETDVTVKVSSQCPSVTKMMNELGCKFVAYEACLVKPGRGPFYEYASEHFPIHAACPIISGITKCIEAECDLALKCNSSIEFFE